MRMQHIGVERAQLFDSRQRRPIHGCNRVTPFHRQWYIDRKDGAILTDQLREPIFVWPGADEIKRQTGMPRLQRDQLQFGSDMMLLLKNLCQPFDSWVLEKCRNMQMRLQCLVDFANHADRQQRVAAQIKEVVPRPHLLQIEPLTPDTSQHLL